MNDYAYVSIVVGFVAVMSLLLYFVNKKQDAKLKEDTEIGMKEPSPRGYYRHADGTLLRKPAKKGRR